MEEKNLNEVDPILEQFRALKQEKIDRETQKTKKNTPYDKKNYLDIKLSKEKPKDSFIIRILKSNIPNETPFRELHMHYIPSQNKSFICTVKSKNLPEGTETKCPFCEQQQLAFKELKGCEDEKKKDALKKIIKENNTIRYFVSRVIDRRDEAFGVKFWKFSETIYDQIIELYETYQANEPTPIDILDSYEGRDIKLSYKYEEGKTKFSRADVGQITKPIFPEKERVEAILVDEKKWNDVFTIKSYDYLSVILDGEEPWFDKQQNKWVSKSDFQAKQNNTAQTTETKFEEYDDNDEVALPYDDKSNLEDLPF